MNIFGWLKAPITLYFHMKSGKTLEIGGVAEYTLNFKADKLTGYEIQFRSASDRILLHLDLDQVEAVTRSNP